MPTVLNEGEKKEPEWWCRHHKENVGYLCNRMYSLIKAIEDGDEERKTMFINMMKAQLPAFVESATR